MALLSDTTRGMLAYWWGLASDGAAGKQPVTVITSAAATLARDLGEPLTFRQAQGMAELAGYAIRMENASETLLAADQADALHSGMVAAAPWGRDLQEQSTSPTWQIKFTMTFLDQEGKQQTEVKTSMFYDSLPGTVGELTDAINQDAQGLADKYEIELLSVQPYQILSVLPMGTAPIHYLRANHRCWTPPSIIAWDTETTWVTEEDKETHTLRCWSAWLIDRRGQRRKTPVSEWGYGTDSQSLARQVTAWAKGRRAIWAYAHNQGFDLSSSMLLDHLIDLGWTVTALVISDKAPWMRLSKGDTVLTLCDSWSAIPASLQHIGSTIGIPKPALPDNDGDDSDWKARCDTDVRILGQALTEVMDWWDASDLGNWSVTGPASGWNAMRHFPTPGKVLIRPEPAECAADRAAIYGGVRYVWQAGQLPASRYVQWDIERAYTVACRDLPLPVERLAKFTGLALDDWRIDNTRHGIIAEVTLHTSTPRYPVRWRNTVWYPVGTFTTTLAGPDIRAARDRGDLLSVGAGWLHRLGRFLWPWATWICDLLDNRIPDTPPVAAIVARGWARSVVGKWAQRSWETRELGASPISGWGHEEAWDHTSNCKAAVIDFAGRRMVQSASAEGDNSYPAVLAFVESYVRCALWAMAATIPPRALVCADTDGMIIDSTVAGPVDPTGIDLGPFRARPKGAWRNIEVIGPQHLTLDDGRRMSGVPASAQPAGDGQLVAWLWPSLNWQVQHGIPGAYVRPRRAYRIGGCYVPAWIGKDGATMPVELRQAVDGTNQMVAWPATRWALLGAVLRDQQHRTLEAVRDG